MKDLREHIESQLEPSMILEMAQIGSFDNNKLTIYVYSREGGYKPHFHIENKDKSFVTCIDMTTNKYFHHGGKEGVLDTRQRKELDKFLRAKHHKGRGETNWTEIIKAWNNNDSSMYVDFDTPQPNYKEIEENK